MTAYQMLTRGSAFSLSRIRVSLSHSSPSLVTVRWFMVVRRCGAVVAGAVAALVRVVAADAEARRWRCGGSAVVVCSRWRSAREDGDGVVLQNRW